MKFSTTIFFLMLFSAMNAQNFTWVKGSNTAGQLGAYGTMGVPSATTNPGGRHGCATWVDQAGNLWLFGGEGFASTNTLTWLNDLWKYNISTQQWTWVRGSNQGNAPAVYGTKGVPASTNEPGAREFMSFWTDASGKFWLFGGDGIISGNAGVRLGDLWRYDPTTNQWTWVNGFNTGSQNGVYGTMGQSNPANMPGGRYGATSWKDNSGNFYVFGGRGMPLSGTVGHLNDLWKYSTATNEWTWLGGSNTTFQNGVYGTLNMPSTTNIPGARYHPGFAQDNAGNFYMFGGLGFGETGGPGYMQDLWKYTPSNNSWTWISGTKVVNQYGLYGTLAVPSNTNLPGGRYSPGAWTDGMGKLWVFGGSGMDASTVTITGQLNDLWKYDPVNAEWTWMKGANVWGTNGVYGTMGVTSPQNMPGSRFYNDIWKDNTGKIWLFGGEGYDISNTGGDHMNDLWGYVIPCNPDSITTSPVDTLCHGAVVTLTAHNTYTGSVSWYSSPTSSTALSNGNTFSTSPLVAAGGQSVYTYYAETNSCSAAPRTAVSVTVNPLPVLLITGDTTTCIGTPVVLTAAGANTYTWMTNAHSTTIAVTPPTGLHVTTIMGTSQAGCVAGDSHSITVYGLPSITVTSAKPAYCAGTSITFTAGGAATYSWSNSAQGSVITVTTSNSAFTPVTVTVTGTDVNSCVASSSRSVALVNCNALNEISGQSPLLSVYPNPAQKNIVVETEELITVLIYNSAGQLVVNKILTEPKQTITFDLPAGIYQLRASSATRVQTFKLVVN